MRISLEENIDQVTGVVGVTLVSTPVKLLAGSVTNEKRWRDTYRLNASNSIFCVRISEQQTSAQASRTAPPAQLMTASGAPNPRQGRKTAGVGFPGFPALQRILKRAQHL